MTFIQPLANNLVVEPFALGEISKGGILIPQVAKASTPYRYAKVVSIGPGRRAADGSLVLVGPQPGDVVAYAKNQGVSFPLEDEGGAEREVLLINESYVLGIMRDLPEQSAITGLDGRLLMMNPGSRGIGDGAYKQMDAVARAKVEGIIDTAGDTLQRMDMLDTAEVEGD